MFTLRAGKVGVVGNGRNIIKFDFGFISFCLDLDWFKMHDGNAVGAPPPGHSRAALLRGRVSTGNVSVL